MRITLHHGLSFPATQALQFVHRRACFPVAGGKGMRQVMPAEIFDSSPLQCVSPCLRIHLHHRIAIVGENVSQMIALSPLQHIHGRLIQRHRMRAAVFVTGGRHPKMPPLQADLLPLQAGHMDLPKTRCDRELSHIRKV
jgi:hypothetical protein